MAVGIKSSENYLSSDTVEQFVGETLTDLPVDGKRVLVIIPDGTRSMPMPLMVDLFEKYLCSRVNTLDYLVALGTHQPMNDGQLGRLIGRTVKNGNYGAGFIYNHEWQTEETFTTIGTISAQEIKAITADILCEDVPVTLNKKIMEYDHLLICGPVFPHEVVGFSGGNKYFFPGIAGQEIINFTHWLGALITSYRIIGAGYTPVRAVIDRAAEFIKTPVSCFSLVVTHEGLDGIYFGSPTESWNAASELSSQTHIRYVSKPYQRVISVMPSLYDDLWTAAKGMYKLEPVIKDGGEVIIYAPHINEVSYTHGRILDEIGYHCSDFFLKQWDKYQKFPRGVLAHSTHLRGLGSFNPETGIEKLRINVTLATGISEERCRRIGLGYIDPERFDPNEWTGRENEGVLVVPRAGEMLYRIQNQ